MLLPSVTKGRYYNIIASTPSAGPVVPMTVLPLFLYMATQPCTNEKGRAVLGIPCVCPLSSYCCLSPNHPYVCFFGTLGRVGQESTNHSCSARDFPLSTAKRGCARARDRERERDCKAGGGRRAAAFCPGHPVPVRLSFAPVVAAESSFLILPPLVEPVSSPWLREASTQQ